VQVLALHQLAHVDVAQPGLLGDQFCGGGLAGARRAGYQDVGQQPALGLSHMQQVYYAQMGHLQGRSRMCIASPSPWVAARGL